MTIQRLQRRPQKTHLDNGLVVALYTAGGPLDDLRAVASEADIPGRRGKASLAECQLPGGTVLVVRWMRVNDDHPATIDYQVVEDGDWLYYSIEYGSLGADTTADLKHWYQGLVT